MPAAVCEPVPYTIPRIWTKATTFIIGGGPSLKSVDLTPLFSRHAIGCNDAYQLGNWLTACCFGDTSWYFKHRRTIGQFTGLKVTNNQCCHNEPGINVTKKLNVGVSIDPTCLAWNHNTGALAINLAILLGAKKIVLLGFDMRLGHHGEMNWHPAVTPANKGNFRRFQNGFAYLKAGIEKEGLDVQVLNATEGSFLRVFPMVRLQDVLAGEKP